MSSLKSDCLSRCHILMTDVKCLIMLMLILGTCSTSFVSRGLRAPAAAPAPADAYMSCGQVAWACYKLTRQLVARSSCLVKLPGQLVARSSCLVQLPGQVVDLSSCKLPGLPDKVAWTSGQAKLPGQVASFLVKLPGQVQNYHGKLPGQVAWASCKLPW